jgi:hypothetical protein
MNTMQREIPDGFGPILRSSPVLEALGGFMSRGEGPDLEVAARMGPYQDSVVVGPAASRAFAKGGSPVALLVQVPVGRDLASSKLNLRGCTYAGSGGGVPGTGMSTGAHGAIGVVVAGGDTGFMSASSGVGVCGMTGIGIRGTGGTSHSG